MSTEQLKTPEQVGIEIRRAVPADLPGIEEFLSRPDIDSLFVPALSDPARGITIADRVQKKFNQGTWIVSSHEGKIVGCMAIVPSSLPQEVPLPNPDGGMPISEGVSFSDWGPDTIMELSTVVTDRSLRDTLKVKGVGAELLDLCKQWVKEKGNGEWGFVTDSWVGGDMGGFVDVMNAKAYSTWLARAGGKQASTAIDTLVRIYSDPSKRGVDGPPTVVYGIPIEDRDWKFFAGKQEEIHSLRGTYDALDHK